MDKDVLYQLVCMDNLPQRRVSVRSTFSDAGRSLSDA